MFVVVKFLNRCHYNCAPPAPCLPKVSIFFISPALTAVLAWLLLGEAFGWLTATGCLASLVGVVLVAQPPFLLHSGGPAWTRQRALGTLCGVLWAASTAAAYICIRSIGKCVQGRLRAGQAAAATLPW